MKALLGLLAAFIAATASGQTSAVRGTTTMERVPLAGVIVSIHSTALQGIRSALTGPTGSYHFEALPPGNYRVTFHLEGMETVSKTAVLSTAMTSIVDANLHPLPVSQEVTVTGEMHPYVRGSGVAVNLSAEEMELLPLQRDVLSVAALASGTNLTSLGVFKLPEISGGPGYDNLIMVNGAVITNSDGTLHSFFIEDAIQETTVLTAGISAEYGRFTGGVIDVVTKSGGNRWSGSIRDSVSNPRWTAQTPYPVPTVDPDTIDDVVQQTLGGFVVRDRLWFFVASRASENNRPRLTTTTNVPYVNAASEIRYEGKLTARISDHHSIVASLLHVDNHQKNGTFNRVYDLQSLIDARFPQSTLTLHHDGIVGRNLLIESRYSRKRFANKGNGSPFTDLIQGTPIVDRSSGTRMNSATFCGVCGARRTSNTAYAIKASAFLSNGRAGDHMLIAGLERFSEQRTINNYLSGSGFTVFASAVQIVGPNVFARFLNDGATYIRWTPLIRLSDGNDLATGSAFVNDDWKLTDRVRANVGFRYDQNRSVDADGTRVSNDHAVSPRLSVVYDLGSNGNHHISAGYGRYVSEINDAKVGGAGEAGGVASQIDFAYHGPDINPRGAPVGQLLSSGDALRILFDWFNHRCDSAERCGVSNLSLLQPGGLRDTPGFAARVGNLGSPRVDEIFVGYAVDAGHTFSMKGNAVLRKWSHFYNYRLDASTPRARDSFGIDHDIAIVQNTDAIKRSYQGIQMQTQWQPSRVRAGMTYTWSKLRGNDEQENQEVRTTPNTAPQTYYPEFLSYANRLPLGYLRDDQRHRARAWIGYEVPLTARAGRLNASLLQSFDSGRRYSARGIIKTTGYDGAPANTNYAGGIPDAAYYFSDRSAFRLQNVIQTDLSLTYRWPLLKSELFLQAELLNVFNQSVPVSVDTTVLTAANSPGLKRFNPFVDTPVEGVHYRFGPLFGQAQGPDSYQQPRRYQFSAGLRF